MPENARVPRTSTEPRTGLQYTDLRRAILFAAGLVVVYQLASPLSTLLLFFLLVFVLAAVLNPTVVWLERRHIPRPVGAIGIVVLLVAILGVVLWLAVPPMVDQVSDFFQNLGSKTDRLQSYYQETVNRFPALRGQLPPPDELLKSATPQVQRLVGQVGRYTLNVVVGVLSLIILLVLVLFSLISPAPILAGLLSAAPPEHEEQVRRALRQIMTQLKAWAVGSLKLGLIVGVMSGMGLHFLGVPYAFLFGIIAGIGELVPNIGPVLSAVPPILLALTQDPKLALYVAILFVVVQQLENNLIVPLVMGQSLDLHPVSVTCAVLVMGSLFGLMGAILAVPTCAIVKVCWREFYLGPRQVDEQAMLEHAQEIVNYEAEAEGPASRPLARRLRFRQRGR